MTFWHPLTGANRGIKTCRRVQTDIVIEARLKLHAFEH